MLHRLSLTRSLDRHKKSALLLENEPLLLCKRKIRRAVIVRLQAGAVAFVSREVGEGNQAKGLEIRALMREPIADEVPAAGRDDPAPILAIEAKSLFLEWINFVANEDGNTHGRFSFAAGCHLCDRNSRPDATIAIVVIHLADRARVPDTAPMRYGPDISRLASLIGDPARANILSALMGGMALTSSELAEEAGVTPQTIASHLAKLADSGLILARQQGRHRYWALADAEVAHLLEGIMGLAGHLGATRTRPGPKEPAMRKARMCYDHLAGEFGVRLHEAAIAAGALRACADGLVPGEKADAFFSPLGLRCEEIDAGKRAFCRECLDWSMRRSHLAGALGAACLARIFALGWARREAQSRVIAFTPDGERQFLAFLDRPGLD